MKNSNKFQRSEDPDENLENARTVQTGGLAAGPGGDFAQAGTEGVAGGFPGGHPGKINRLDIFAPNQIIDRTYCIISLIGEGGAGQVYRALHSELKKEVALKLLNTASIDSADWTRFQHEAQLIGRLSHDGIVKVYDFGVHEGTRPYYAMEVLDGESLAKSIKKFGPLSALEAVALFLNIADALKYAHEKGIVHRDIKPDNIFLARDRSATGYHAKLLDFGIAKLQAGKEGDRQRLTQMGQLVGSPLYMSPEQCQGLETDLRSDIYSLGCTIFEAISGEPPLRGKNAMATVLMHCEVKPPLLSERTAEEVPARLSEVVARCLEKERGKRYQSMDELIEDLQWIAQNLKNVSQIVKTRPARFEPLGKIERSRTGALPSKKVLITGGSIFTLLTTAIVFFTVKPLEQKAAPKIGPVRIFGHSAGEGEAPAEIPIIARRSFLVKTGSEGKHQYRQYDFSEAGDVGKFEINRLSLQKEKLANPRTLKVYDGEFVQFSPSRNFCENPDNFLKFDATIPNRLDIDGPKYLEVPLIACLTKLSHIKALQFINLDMDDMGDSELASLDRLPGLTSLNISKTFITCENLARANFVDRLERLQMRHLSGDPTALFERMARANRIQHLESSEIPLSAKAAQRLGSIKSLVELNIGLETYGKEQIEPLLNLPKLNSLWLQDAQLKADCIPVLKRFKQLKGMYFTSRQGWSEAQISELKKALPKVQVEFPKVRENDNDGQSDFLKEMRHDFKTKGTDKPLGL